MGGKLRFVIELVVASVLACVICRALGWQILPRASDGIYSGTAAWIAILLLIVFEVIGMVIRREKLLVKK